VAIAPILKLADEIPRPYTIGGRCDDIHVGRIDALVFVRMLERALN
jgi:hypothetical protein